MNDILCQYSNCIIVNTAISIPRKRCLFFESRLSRLLILGYRQRAALSKVLWGHEKNLFFSYIGSLTTQRSPGGRKHRVSYFLGFPQYVSHTALTCGQLWPLKQVTWYFGVKWMINACGACWVCLHDNSLILPYIIRRKIFCMKNGGQDSSVETTD